MKLISSNIINFTISGIFFSSIPFYEYHIQLRDIMLVPVFSDYE